MSTTVGSRPPQVLYDPAMVASAGTQFTRAWKPPIRGLREVFHATFASHAYPPHTHDVWTVFIVDAGAIRYALDGRAHGAGQARVTVLPPHVVHDGRPATDAGFRKRVLYLETSLLGEHLIGPAVDRPIVADIGLRSDVAALHDALVCAEDLLDAETRLADVTDRIARSFGGAAPEPPAESGPVLAEHLRGWFDQHLFESVTIEAAAREIGATPTQLSRAFSAVFGITPHAYVIGRRLEAARDRILAGQALADVAAEVGFCDQAHLSRRFSRFLGTTPGRYRGGSPD
jgi:AraC-like DNA-binding protein